MNNLYLSLFIIALGVGLSNALAIKMKNSVHFINSLAGNNVLKIHCRSDEDDLGEHLLKPGEVYDFSFYDSIFGTRINCDLAQGIEFRFLFFFGQTTFIET
ncbi:hypothetical protein BRARA_C00122 [Brassica rapa]|uniref:S-protein homolog n=1 Tax=Brassica campestris TaxID=3711 RepID=A0A397ZR04_BRACM|nr:hypothetical protein BRARA_C00122 [Brassica rapa]